SSDLMGILWYLVLRHHSVLSQFFSELIDDRPNRSRGAVKLFLVTLALPFILPFVSAFALGHLFLRKLEDRTILIVACMSGALNWILSLALLLGRIGD